MSTEDFKMIALGDEHDDALRAKLDRALSELGAVVSKKNWGVGGSQELEEVEVLISGEVLQIESETFVGLSISGPADLVMKVQAMVARKN